MATLYIDGAASTKAKVAAHLASAALSTGMDPREMNALLARALRNGFNGEDARDALIEYGVEIII